MWTGISRSRSFQNLWKRYFSGSGQGWTDEQKNRATHIFTRIVASISRTRPSGAVPVFVFRGTSDQGYVDAQWESYYFQFWTAGWWNSAKDLHSCCVNWAFVLELRAWILIIHAWEPKRCGPWGRNLKGNTPFQEKLHFRWKLEE